MNVYDFDKTIYDGDSTIDFYFLLFKKTSQNYIMFTDSVICCGKI